MYLKNFIFPDKESEYDFFIGIKRTCYNSFYPFQILSNNEICEIEFSPITILYGGNGSGKTTALNVMAEALDLRRDSLYNRSEFFEDYVSRCRYEMNRKMDDNSRIITSDDVFDYMMNLRTLNQGIDGKREELFHDYLTVKHAKFQLTSLDDYEKLKRVNDARRMTQSKFVKQELIENIREYSNGESGFKYFTEKITENSLFLLDEPENSLSPSKQMELVQFIEDSVRFFGCQVIIATHSPFILALREARIYDFDNKGAMVTNWATLSNVRTYYEFFKGHEDRFN